jgi:hypothetical protein
MPDEKRTVIIPLMGGLGNQLFQFAAGLYTKKFSNKDVRFSLDGLTIAKNTARSYMLGDLLKQSDLTVRGRFLLAIFRLCSFVLPSIWVSEREPNDTPLARITNSTKVLIGYFQRHDYVDSVAAEIIQSLTHSNTFRSLVLAPTHNDLAVHLRFGDYLTSPDAKSFHGLTAMSYYIDGVNYLLSVNSFDRVVIYSDDPSKAYSDFTQAFGSSEIPIVLSAHSGEIEELASMSSSKGLVISNSTFSWWAAWIGTHLHECSVVAPRPWFATPSAADDNLLSNRWTVLDRELQP